MLQNHHLLLYGNDAENLKKCWEQCFGSGSTCSRIEPRVVFRIRIHVDPYWNGSPGSGSVFEIRIRIRIQDSQKKEKNLWFQFKKRIDHFAEGMKVFPRAWESSINVLQKFVMRNNICIFHFFFLVMKKPGSGSVSTYNVGSGSILRSIRIRNTDNDNRSMYSIYYLD